MVPEGLKLLLTWLKDEYNDPEIIITENGFSDTGEINDEGRVNYYQVVQINDNQCRNIFKKIFSCI